MIAISVFITIIFVCLFTIPTAEKCNSRHVVAVLGCICLYWGFSYINAPDTTAYMMCYDGMPSNVGDVRLYNRVYYRYMEPGFMYLMFYLKKITNSYYTFQFLLYVIEMTLMWNGLNRVLNDKQLLLLFLCVSATSFALLMSAMRQGVAIALFFYSLPYIKNYKYWFSILLLLFASLFHSSAIYLIVFAVIYWLNPMHSLKDTLLKRIAIVTFVLCNIVYFFNLSVSSFIGDAFMIMSDSEFANHDYTDYILSIEDESNYGVLKILEMDVCYILLFFTGWFGKTEKYRLLTMLFVIYFLLNTLIGGMMVHRITYYLDLVYLFVLFDTLVVFIKRKLKSGINVAATIIGVYEIGVFLLFKFVRSRGYLLEYHLFDFLN